MASLAWEYMVDLKGFTPAFLAVMVVLSLLGFAVAGWTRVKMPGELRTLESAFLREAARLSHHMSPEEYLRLHMHEERVVHTLDAIPGALITLGILGTFIGLGMAVGEAAAAMTDETAAIAALESLMVTVGVKFQTSAWGILLSLLFSMIIRFPLIAWMDGAIEASARTLVQHLRGSDDGMREAFEASAVAMERAYREGAAQLNAAIEAALDRKLGTLAVSMRSAAEALDKNAGELSRGAGKLHDGAAEMAKAVSQVGPLIRDQLKETQQALVAGSEKQRQAMTGALGAMATDLERQLKLGREAAATAAEQQKLAQQESGAMLNRGLERLNKSTEELRQTQALLVVELSKISRTQEDFREQLKEFVDMVSEMARANLEGAPAAARGAVPPPAPGTKAKRPATESDPDEPVGNLFGV